jgi:HAD superfamily hydrolase (TIGR01509 family)
MPIELVIFDCDGVLVDTETVGADVVTQGLLEWGVKPPWTTAWQPGESLTQALDRIRHLHSLPDHAEAILRSRMHQAFEDHPIDIPGMQNLVGSMHTPWAIASNGPKEKMHLSLRLAGYTTLRSFSWNRVFSGAELKRFKPDPALFLHTAATLGTRPQNCLIIEDSETGLTAAERAGIRSVHFRKEGADHSTQTTPWQANGAAGLGQMFRELGLVS